MSPIGPMRKQLGHVCCGRAGQQEHGVTLTFRVSHDIIVGEDRCLLCFVHSVSSGVHSHIIYRRNVKL